jgi:phage-related protein
MPHSRPIRSLGPGCHELRIPGDARNWRIVYHLSADAIVILEVFPKKTPSTPKWVLEACRRRLRSYLTR